MSLSLSVSIGLWFWEGVFVKPQDCQNWKKRIKGYVHSFVGLSQKRLTVDCKNVELVLWNLSLTQVNVNLYSSCLFREDWIRSEWDMFNTCFQMWPYDDQPQLNLTLYTVRLPEFTNGQVNLFIRHMPNFRGGKLKKKFVTKHPNFFPCSPRAATSRLKKVYFAPSTPKSITQSQWANTNQHIPLLFQVSDLLVWVQEIRFGKQSGAAGQLKCALLPGRQTVCAPVNLLIFRPAAARISLRVNIGLIWNDLPDFLLRKNDYDRKYLCH